MALNPIEANSQKARKERVLNMIKPVLAENLMDYRPVKVFIFGSQANRETWKGADIDIGIDAQKPLDRKVFNKINFILNEELSTLYTFDIVDFKKVEDSFKKIALKNIELIYLLDDEK